MPTSETTHNTSRTLVVIPNYNGLRFLPNCMEALSRQTVRDFTTLVIDNASGGEDITWLRTWQAEDPARRKLLQNDANLGFSGAVNQGIRIAMEEHYEFTLLLNNDTEVISPRWIEEMVMYAQQSRVGCVGAKLLYPDNTIQHAGIGFGFLTLAAHMHKNFPVGHPGYMGRLSYAQDVYAVTAACLMVRKDVYEQVDGLDESFAVAFNDVDFCVRVREAGYTNVFTPFAQLYHYESKSRGLDESPVKRKRFISEVERFQKRWAKQLAAGDPCMNPNFDLMKEDFSFDIKPLE